jgi:hypothetical protein
MDEMTRRQLVSSAAAAGAVGLTVVATPTSAAEQGEAAAQRQAESEFIVKFKGIKLSHEDEARIASEIQIAVMRGLAGIDLRPRENLEENLKFRFPNPGWLGLWIDKLKTLEIPNLQVQEVGQRR